MDEDKMGKLYKPQARPRASFKNPPTSSFNPSAGKGLFLGINITHYRPIFFQKFWFSADTSRLYDDFNEKFNGNLKGFMIRYRHTSKGWQILNEHKNDHTWDAFRKALIRGECRLNIADDWCESYDSAVDIVVLEKNCDLR